ncbi:hypothetical protein G5B39_01960 [Rhodobacteraceae bacterium SC52]|nr:hypothetical protein G5B39_01960 [Rhodobacteraceae bacterium SC52]
MEQWLLGYFGIWAYLTQQEADRKHQVLSERRAVYMNYAEVMADHLFKKISINSVAHLERRNALNKVGAKLSIVAIQSIVDSHAALISYLSEKEQATEDGDISSYFDEPAQELFDLALSEMRSDALPKSVRITRD